MKCYELCDSETYEKTDGKREVTKLVEGVNLTIAIKYI